MNWLFFPFLLSSKRGLEIVKPWMCFPFQEKKEVEGGTREFSSNLPGPKFTKKTSSTPHSLHFPGDVSVFLLYYCNA